MPTYRLDDPDVRADCLARADQLVFKPVDGSGGHGIVIGPQASDEELAEMTRKVAELPAGVRRPGAGAAVHGAVPGRRRARPRHVDLRPFATNDGERVRCCPAG